MRTASAKYMFLVFHSSDTISSLARRPPIPSYTLIYRRQFYSINRASLNSCIRLLAALEWLFNPPSKAQVASFHLSASPRLFFCRIEYVRNIAAPPGCEFSDELGGDIL